VFFQIRISQKTRRKQKAIQNLTHLMLKDLWKEVKGYAISLQLHTGLFFLKISLIKVSNNYYISHSIPSVFFVGIIIYNCI